MAKEGKRNAMKRLKSSNINSNKSSIRDIVRYGGVSSKKFKSFHHPSPRKSINEGASQHTHHFHIPTEPDSIGPLQSSL